VQESPLAQQPFYSATPTIQVDGQSDDKLTSLLLAMEMREREGGMSALELRFTNYASLTGGGADFAFEDGTVLKLGAAVQVYAGDVSSPTEIFRGKITALEGRYRQDGAPDLVVLAEDVLQAARMSRRTKNWESATLSAIVAQVAGNIGLIPVTAGLDSNVGTQLQFNETDLQFLRRLLSRYDADLQVVGTELHAAPRSQAQRNNVTIDLGSQLREVRVVADLAHQVTQVTTTGWDYGQGQTISATSQTTSLGPGSGKTGSAWLQQALAARSDQLAAFGSLNADEAQSLVDAEFAERTRSFVVAHGVSDGNPNLRVGTSLTLNGLGQRFSNTYYTTATTHRFDTTGGYQTQFTAECAYLGGSS
jgi:phage protein D